MIARRRARWDWRAWLLFAAGCAGLYLVAAGLFLAYRVSTGHGLSQLGTFAAGEAAGFGAGTLVVAVWQARR